MAVSRRGLLAGAAAWAAGPAAARRPRQELFVSCGADPDGGFLVAGLGADGTPRFQIPLPARGHGAACHPTRPHCVVFARRPGSFAYLLDTVAGSALRRITTIAGRHFYGHGAFSSDGRTLFATENDYASGRGVLGIYDAADGYRRAAEISSHGIGPHEMRLLPDNKTLAVANGGIRTHPDHGRAKLNLATMAPNLTLLDSASGALRGLARLPAELHRLSIRHLDVDPDGRLAVAMQYEGDRRDLVPLLGLYEGGDRIRLLEAPAPIARRMRQYSGSVAFDRSGARIVLSSPRGHLVTLWDARRATYLGSFDAPDACGLAATGTDCEILVTGGDGHVRLVDGWRGTLSVLGPRASGPRWDNHIARLEQPRTNT